MSQSIVTIQLGNYSNFIGSHFWNLHENSFKNVTNGNDSIDYDVHYSEGETESGVTTFTPRLICVDWKENLGANIIDDIYEEIDNEFRQKVESRRDLESLKVRSFGGKVAVHTGLSGAELAANKRGDLEAKADYEHWNEYLYSRYHPRSLMALPKLFRGFNRDNFRTFSQGVDLASSFEFKENMEEQTRYFVEKCDSLQGFQLLSDRNSGFSGVATAWLDHLNDEYRQPVISISVDDTKERTTESLFNDVSSLTGLNSSSIITTPLSLTTPLNTPRDVANVAYNFNSKYHTSAILASAIKSMTLPCVLRKKLYSICDFNSLVCERDNNLVSLALSMPLPLSDSLCGTLTSNTPDRLYSTLNPFSSSISTVHSAIGNIYGVSPSKILTADQKKHPFFRHCSSVSETMKMYIDQHFHINKTQFFSLIEPEHLSNFYPKIFKANIDPFSGHLASSSSSYLSEATLLCPREVPLSTMMYTDDNSQNLLPIYQLAKEALRRNKSSDILSLTEWDSLIEMLENFRNII